MSDIVIKKHGSVSQSVSQSVSENPYCSLTKVEALWDFSWRVHRYIHGLLDGLLDQLGPAGAELVKIIQVTLNNSVHLQSQCDTVYLHKKLKWSQMINNNGGNGTSHGHYLKQSGAIWNHLEQFGTILSNLKQFGAFWSHFEPVQTIWSHFKPF